MSSSFSEESLISKFEKAENRQDNIQTLSLWLLHHKAHHQKIVATWMKVLQKDTISHRLTLFYLANDVIQNSRRKKFPHYMNSFAEVLRDATMLVRDDKIRPNIQRVFNIWEERKIYTPEFIAELCAILAHSKVPASANSVLLSQFKPDLAFDKIRKVQALENEVKKKLASINLTKLNATNAEMIQQLKDRNHGQQFKREFDENAKNLEHLIEKMLEELKERHELVLLLEQCQIYFDKQKSESKVVGNAYKSFGLRVNQLRKKLEDLTAALPSPSPVPSPVVDAPSPSSDQELELDLPDPENKEPENVQDAPSPEGSPIGLNLSPPGKAIASEAAKSIGNPIPTLSNFFSNDKATGMSSWMGSFQSKDKKSTTTDSDSLDSRLSNLLQNIPNLPSTLFGSDIASTKSPTTNTKQMSTTAPSPGKEECSGQNTPLQDEDTPSSFFTKLATPGKSQSPKDILMGLTSYIKSVASEKDDKKFYSPTDMFEGDSGMSSFIKTGPPIPTQASSVASSYFNTAQPAGNDGMVTTANTYQQAPVVNSYQSASVNSYQTTAVGAYQPPPINYYQTTAPPSNADQTATVNSYQSAPINSYQVAPMNSYQAPPPNAYQSAPLNSYQTVPSNPYPPPPPPPPPTVNSYQTTQYSNVPTYTVPAQNNMYMQPIVPSGPQENYGYSTEAYTPDDYNPEMATYDDSMDLDENVEDAPSPPSEPSPPRNEPIDKVPRQAPARRLSTLVTIVTKDSPDRRSAADSSDGAGGKSDKENETQESPDWTKVTEPPPILKESPKEDFFIGVTEDVPNIQIPSVPSTRELMSPRGNRSNHMSRMDGKRDDRWFGNDRSQNNNWNDGPRPNFRGHGNRFNDNHRNFNRPNFRPRQEWDRGDFQMHRPDFHGPTDFGPRHRPFPQRHFGPPQNQRFPFRARGRGRMQY